jgi:hypothetical protein
MKAERPEIFPQWQRLEFARQQLERARAEFDEARKEWERV